MPLSVRQSQFSGYPFVVIESPYAGAVDYNVSYAKACVLDSIRRGEVPFASHLFYTQMLDDYDPESRALGIKLNLRWIDFVRKIVVYTDLGISIGMQEAINHAANIGAHAEYRTLIAPGSSQ